MFYELLHQQPRAFVARAVEVIPDDEAKLERIHGPGFDPASLVLLDREPPCPVGGGAGSAEIVRYTSNEVTLSVESETSSLVVLSDQFYPGWTAAVDETPAEVLRADMVLRAVCVPAGQHTVTMAYRPASFFAGGGISLGALAAIGFVTWRYRGRLRRG